MSQKTVADDRTPLLDRPTASINRATKPLIGLSGALPPPPAQRKHSKWEASYIHSAQCDGCHTKKHKVMQRCTSCTLQYCKSCMPKARQNAHEYVEEELDWDPNSAPPQFRDHGSLKKKIAREEKVELKSQLGGGIGGFGSGKEEDELEEEGLVMVGSSSSLSGKGGKLRGGARQRDMGNSNQRLMSENEKYQGQGYETRTIFGGPPTRNAPEYGGYADRDMLMDDENEGFNKPLNKRRRNDGVSASMTGNSSSRYDDVEFTSQRFNDGTKQGSFSSNINDRRPSIRQQSDNNRSQQQRQPASTASSRLNQSQSQFYNQSQQEAQPHGQTKHSLIRRAALMLNAQSTFEDATDAVMKAQEDEETLPARRQKLDEYCKEAWRYEPVLRQLREEGRGEEARELYYASRKALWIARGLVDGDDE
ncbi:hypothetical protein BKA65DRAFT_472801 [Rhexocercosporidium sp. MPI-PUGE-AT-0058]|nr:hypothetical protein BKA65DRAFT_472801 [Rhexocercosporidium sp. MPI-PUGE-AT-0058]